MKRIYEAQASHGLVAQNGKPCIRVKQVFDGLRSQEKRSSDHAVVGTSKCCTKMMAGDQPTPGISRNRMAENRNPIIGGPHTLNSLASTLGLRRIVFQVV